MRLGEVLGAGLIGLGVADVSSAAEVGGGGPLTLTISGSAAFQAHGGALDNQRGEREVSTGLDFSNDTEVHVLLRGREDRTGLDYGGTVEFEANTSDTTNSDESWLFVRGAFGELRLGDDDGAADDSALGAGDIAAGTGGIDGEVIDELVVDAVGPSNSEDASKLRYYTPAFAGFYAGVSYTPNATEINEGDGQGDSLAQRSVDAGDWVEAALVYEREFGEVELKSSLVGSWGAVKNQDSETFDGNGTGRLWAWYGGFIAEIDDVGIGAGFGDEDVGGLERRYFNVGAALDLEPASVSVTYGRVLHTAGYPGVGEPWNVVLSADVGLAAGLVLAGDLAYSDNDLDRAAREETGGDSGWAWVVRLEVEF